MGFFRIHVLFKRRSRKHGRNCKTRISSRRRIKKDGSSRPWSDLPQAIVELFINRLHLTDQIRALAVCKNWQLCNDYIKCSDRLPWVVSYERNYSPLSQKVEFICELFDPYSQEIVSRVSMDLGSGYLYILDSRHGWLLLGDEETNLFLHNPFTNKTIYLPLSVDNQNMQAVMSASPTSPNCGIYMLSIEDDLYFKLDTCYLSKHGTERTEVEIDELDGNVYIHSMLYMKGNIYHALLEDDVLDIYVLKDGSPELLASGFPEPYELYDHMADAWLMEVDGNLMIVRVDRRGKQYEWMVFRFDWSKMSWVIETNLKNCAIYINGKVAFSAPLANNCGEILGDAQLFYLDEYGDGGMEIKNYSLNEEGGTEIQSSEYGWINNYRGRDWSFVEPSSYISI